MNRTVLKKLFRYIRPHMRYVVGSILSAAGNVALSLWVPILIGQAVDYIVGVGAVDFHGMLPILARLACAIAGCAGCNWLMGRCNIKITYRTVRDMRVDAFNRLQSVPLRYIDRNAHGDLLSRLVNDIDQVSDGLMQGFTQLFTGVATIAGTLVIMLTIDRTVALFVVLATPASLLLAWFIAKRSYHSFRVQMRQRGEMGGYAEEMIGGQTVVKAFGYQRQAQERFEEINNRLYKSGVKSQFFSSLTNPSTRLVSSLVYAGAGVIGAFAAIAGGVSVGQLSSILLYANQYMKPFNEISGVVTELQAAFASAGRVFELIEQPVEEDAADALVMTDSGGNVEMKDVSFSYEPDQNLIEGLNLYAESGERVAIVGPTGSGKTTIINLLMRFYDADSGTIRIDSIDIKRITRNSLRSMYGMVLQETWLFTGTVRENIAFGRPGATEEEVVRAAKDAGAHSFIRRLPNGYDTVIQADDAAISQGQQQLLCIARIMLAKPPMLILDEATSNIDTRTEMKIQAAFAKMMEHRTSFVVAHRLSTITGADIILVMKDGRIVEQGGHRELLERDGFYAGLYRSQFER